MLFQKLIDLFFPPVCSGCKAFLLENEKTICTSCRFDLPLTQFHLHPENEAFKKFYGKIPVEHVSAFLYFNKSGIVQEMIHNLKYRGHEEIGTVLGDWYSHELKLLPIINHIDAIIPVPLHSKKLKERGYNQVTTFGKALSDRLEIPYDDQLLIRKIYSKTQSQKNLEERTAVLQPIFDVNYSEIHHNKHFLLIDDVITTGSTLESCGRAILKIPGAKLSIVTMAIAH
jgi:ComF family protein